MVTLRKSWRARKTGSNTYRRTSASVTGCCGSNERLSVFPMQQRKIMMRCSLLKDSSAFSIYLLQQDYKNSQKIPFCAAEVNKKGAASRSETQLPFSIQNPRNRSLISSSVSPPRSACPSTCIACATAAFHSSTLIFPRTFLCFSRL